MQKMIKFRLSRECREIAVNPARVLYVCHYEHGCSSLHFSKDCFVRVKGSLDEVTQLIEAALCSEAGEPEPVDATKFESERSAAQAN